MPGSRELYGFSAVRGIEENTNSTSGSMMLSVSGVPYCAVPRYLWLLGYPWERPQNVSPLGSWTTAS